MQKIKGMIKSQDEMWGWEGVEEGASYMTYLPCCTAETNTAL